jgi:hypothetical protein
LELEIFFDRAAVEVFVNPKYSEASGSLRFNPIEGANTFIVENWSGSGKAEVQCFGMNSIWK